MAGTAKPQSCMSLAGQSMITKDGHRISCESFVIMDWARPAERAPSHWGATR
jgi:hypothetical protein